MADGKPFFDHPQSQNVQPIGQVFGAQTDFEGLQIKVSALTDELHRLIATHIHNGTQSPRINANTDIIGSLGTQPDVILTDGATVALNAGAGNVFMLTAAGNRTISPPTNPSANQKIIIKHKASGANRTLTLSTSAGGFRFGAITLAATTSGKIDYIGCIYNLTDNFWDVVAYAQGF